jgi:hypothetical protein
MKIHSLDDFGFERDIAENGKIAVEKCKVILTMYFDGSSNACEWDLKQLNILNNNEF